MKRVVNEITGLLSTAMTTSFKKYYQGEVVAVPQSYTPALMVFGNSTEVIAKSTAKDQLLHNITIRAMIDVKGVLDEAGTGLLVKAQQSLYDLVEATDASGDFEATSILGVLRTNANVRGTFYLFNNTITVEYNTLAKGEWPYVSAEITLEAVTDLKKRL